MKKRSAVLATLCIILLAVFVYGQANFEKNLIREEYLYGDTRTVVTVLAGQSTSDAGVEDMIDEMVSEKFPHIKLEWECVDWGESFASQMRGRLAAGDTPDLIIGKVQDVYTYAQSGNLAPLHVKGTERIDESVLGFVTVDGEVYGIPYNAWYQGVIYNKKLFDRCHVKVPQTLQELNDAVAIFEANGITPFAAHFQESWKVANMTMQFMINDIFKENPDWGAQFCEGKTSFAGDANAIRCIEQNKYILEHSWPDAFTIEQYESDKRFAEGEAAMYLSGSWSLQNVGEYDATVQYGIFPFPNQNGDAKLIKETNMTFMVSKTSPHQDVISELLEELLQNEKLMREILGFTQTYPVVSDFTVSYETSVEADIQKYIKEDQIIDAFSGNSQLQWEFQNELAAETEKWLRGETDLADILQKADERREESSSIISK